MEYTEAIQTLRSAGWVIEIQAPTMGGINTVTVWRSPTDPDHRVITMWYPGYGQWELFRSSPRGLPDAMKTRD